MFLPASTMVMGPYSIEMEYQKHKEAQNEPIHDITLPLTPIGVHFHEWEQMNVSLVYRVV